MGTYGDFFNKKNKKLSKEEMAKKAGRVGPVSYGYTPPRPEVIRKGKKLEQS